MGLNGTKNHNLYMKYAAIRGGNQKFPELLKKLFEIFVQV